MAKQLKGTIISTKLHNTATIEVMRALTHPLYKKTVKKHKKFLVDTRGFSVSENDQVVIQECSPISKRKHFKIIKKIS